MPNDIESVGNGQDDGMKREITACIDGLQQAFGPRIERILGTGNGLLTVLDQVGGEDDRIAAELSHRIPVAWMWKVLSCRKDEFILFISA